MCPWTYTNGWAMTFMHEWGNRKENLPWPFARQNGCDKAKSSNHFGWLLFSLWLLLQHSHKLLKDMYSWCHWDGTHFQRHEAVSPSSQSTDNNEKQPLDPPFLGELLLWCYLHISVPPHILQEHGKLLLIRQETLGATKITVLDVDVDNTKECIRTTDALFLVNCCLSYFRHFSSINVSDTRLQISSSYLWGASWDSRKSHSRLKDRPKVQNFWRCWWDFLHELWLSGHQTFATINFHASKMRIPQWDHDFHVIVVRYHGRRRHFGGVREWNEVMSWSHASVCASRFASKKASWLERLFLWLPTLYPVARPLIPYSWCTEW